MLDHHPHIAFHSEAAFLVRYLPEAPGARPDMNAYLQRLAEDRSFLHSNFQIDPSLDYDALVHSFLEQKRRRDNKPFVGATVHHAFDRLPEIWPKARYIHLIRDPRDVAHSIVQMGWAGNVYEGAAAWLRAEATWTRLVAQLCTDQYIEVRYSDLIRNYESILSDICHFIGVAYSSSMLDYADHSTYGLPDPALVAKWRRKMTDMQVRLVEARVGNRLTELGFEPSGLPPLRISATYQYWLRLHSRWNRALYRLRRYGLWLYIQDLAARRLGCRALKAKIQPAMTAIDEQYIR